MTHSRTVGCPCGTTFTTTHPHQKYCSLKCQKRAHKRRKAGKRASREVIHPPCATCGTQARGGGRGGEKYCSSPCAATGKRLARDTKRRPAEERTCPCGGSFTTNQPHKKYCSEQCARRAQREREKARAQPSRRIRSDECEVCGTPFMTTWTAQKYCSTECSRSAQRERRRAKAEADGRTITPPRLCEECDAPFTTTHSHKKYCSQRCARSSAERMAEAGPPPLAVVTCWCGEEFMQARRNQTNCSRECNRSREVERKRLMRQRSSDRSCRWCGKACRPEELYCSVRCGLWAAEGTRKSSPIAITECSGGCGGLRCWKGKKGSGWRCEPCKEAEASRPREGFVSGPCAECGEQFTAKYFLGGNTSYHCSERCARKKRQRTARHRRRARLKDAKSESFAAREIHERDGWVCQLCGKPTRPDLPSGHNLYPSLDHITPLSKGGDHTRANTQCAHRICNSYKNDGVFGQGEQLRLVLA